MADYRTLALNLIAVNGKIDNNAIKLLKKMLIVEGKIASDDVSFLNELRTVVCKKMKKTGAKFDDFYLKCLHIRCLENGVVSSHEVELIGKQIIDDKAFKNSTKKKFLNGVKNKATLLAPEFDALYEKIKK